MPHQNWQRSINYLFQNNINYFYDPILKFILMESTSSLPVLTAEELRVLGSLIEKSKTTPDYYPMTLNALTAACNQKTSRRPVVEYDEETIVPALNRLKGQSLVSTAVGGGSRVTKYKHNF